MVPEMNCAECREHIQEASLVSENALELSAALSASAQTHLQGCSACREACAELIQLDAVLGGLSDDLAAPDMRSSVMAFISTGERMRASAETTAQVAAPSLGIDLEEALLALSAELPAPDVSKAVMARVRANRNVEPFAAREVVCVMLALTVGTAWFSPTWIPWFSALSEWLSAFSGFGLSLPEVSLDPLRDISLLACLLLACIWQTRSWMQVRHG